MPTLALTLLLRSVFSAPPSSPPSPLPSWRTACEDRPNAFDVLVSLGTEADGSCSAVVNSTFDRVQWNLCTATAGEYAAQLYAFGVVWQPPIGNDEPISEMCRATCESFGVAADECAPLAPPSPPNPPSPPPQLCEVSACRQSTPDTPDDDCCGFPATTFCAPGFVLTNVLPVSAGGTWHPPAGVLESCWEDINPAGNTCCTLAPPSPPEVPPPPPPPPEPPALPPPPVRPPPPDTPPLPPLLPGAVAAGSLATLRAFLEASAVSKAPLVLQLPEGARFALGGTPLEVDGFNLTLRGSGAGSELDGEGLSRIIEVADGGSVELFDLLLVNGYAGDAFVEDGEDGGAMHVGTGSSATLSGIRIGSCLALGYGGAIAASDGSTATLIATSISECAADGSAGAVALSSGAAAALEDVVITNCTCETAPGGAMVLSGGSEAVLTGSTIASCHSSGSGGGAIWAKEGSTLALVETTIIACTVVGSGGAMFLADGSSLTMIDAVITRCVSGRFAGAFFVCTGAVATVIDSTIADCHTLDFSGGAVVAYAFSAAVLSGTSIVANCSTVGNGGAFIASINSHITMTNGTSVVNCSAEANGGAFALSAQSSATLTAVTVASCSAQTAGGAFHLDRGSTATLTATIVVRCSVNASDGRGGGFFVMSSTLLLSEGTSIVGNSAAFGRTLFLLTGTTATYILPAPAGMWIAATECLVYRSACPWLDGPPAYQEPACLDAVSSCQLEPDATAEGCEPITFSQPCDWSQTPDMIGSLVQVLPQGAMDMDYPYSCGPGFRGSAEPSEQMTSLCAGPCPAGTYQPDVGATACLECPLHSFCTAGTASPSSCPVATYGHTTGLRSEEECTPCPAGGYCVSGEFFPCTTGAFGVEVDASNAAACVSCNAHFAAEHLVTAAVGASSAAQCVCDVGFYDKSTSGDERRCTACSVEMVCTGSGLTLASVPLAEHRWRLSNRTDDIHECDVDDGVSACDGGSGGEGASYCVDGHVGPRCAFCSNSSEYYDAERATCRACGDLTGRAFQGLAVLVAVAIVLALLYRALLQAPAQLARINSALSQLAAAMTQFGFQAKFKLAIGFFQVWTVRKSVYGVETPEELSRWLSVFDFLGFDLGVALFPSWACLGDLRWRIAFNALWPLGLMAAVCAALVSRELLMGRSARQSLLSSLRAAIFISFCVIPSVTRSLFLAFQCESFGFDDTTSPSETKSHLTASINVECSSDEHGRFVALASVFIVIWPVGMPLLYAVLLHRCRRAVREHQPSGLSRATHFLWKEYHDAYFWWELVELAKKLVLTNVLLLVDLENGQDKFLRLVFGLMICCIGLTLQLIARPFRRPSDNALSSSTQLMLVMFFITALLAKMCDIDAVVDSCTVLVGIQTAYSIVVVMICSGFVVLFLPLGMLVRQLKAARKIQTLRVASTMQPPELLLSEGHRFHLFLSHLWATGQDQCANIKSSLQLLLPGVKIFLDVDDLDDIGKLESYVRETSVSLFFLSRGYFSSRNVLREVRASLSQNKPLVLVHEQQQSKGGGPLEAIKAECQDDFRAKIFVDSREPIAWHRVLHYQNLTLKLIATAMLGHTPKYSGSPGSTGAFSLVLPDEMRLSELSLKQPLVLWCSQSNVGALAIAQELAASLHQSSAPIRVVEDAPADIAALEKDGETFAMLLYLNKDTWSVDGDELENDVRYARGEKPGLLESSMSRGKKLFGARPSSAPSPSLPSPGRPASNWACNRASSRDSHSGVVSRPSFDGRRHHASPAQMLVAVAGRRASHANPHIILVHENDPARGAVDFGHFFGVTPKGLVDSGIYRDIAVALHTPPHREVSLALAAQAMGAEKVRRHLHKGLSATLKSLGGTSGTLSKKSIATLSASASASASVSASASGDTRCASEPRSSAPLPPIASARGSRASASSSARGHSTSIWVEPAQQHLSSHEV